MDQTTRQMQSLSLHQTQAVAATPHVVQQEFLPRGIQERAHGTGVQESATSNLGNHPASVQVPNMPQGAHGASAAPAYSRRGQNHSYRSLQRGYPRGSRVPGYSTSRSRGTGPQRGGYHVRSDFPPTPYAAVKCQPQYPLTGPYTFAYPAPYPAPSPFVYTPQLPQPALLIPTPMSYPLVQPQIPYQSQGPPKRARSWSDEASMMTGESRGAHHTEQRFTQAHDSSPRQRLTHAHDPSPRKRMRHNYKPKARDNTVKKLPPYFYNSTLPTPRSNPQPPQPQPTGGNPHIHSGQHSLSSQQYPVDLIMQDPDPRELATLPRPGIPISNNTTTQVSSLHPDTTVNLTEVTVEDLTHLGSTGAHDRGTIPKTTSTFTFALGAPSVRTVSNTAAAATSALHPDTNVNLIEVTMEDPTHLSPTSATNEENQQQNTTFTSALGARGAREDANTAAVADSTSSNNEEKQQNITFTSALSAHSVREVSNVGVEATAAQAALAADNLSPEEKTEGQEGFGWRMEE